MESCMEIEKKMLINPVDLKIDDGQLDFNRAKFFSDGKANELLKSPMLLSWYNRRSGHYSPSVTCCSEEKPGWLVYAESRGGNLSVTVNDEQYVFIYTDLM